MFREKNKYGVELKQISTQLPRETEKKIKEFCQKAQMPFWKFICEACNAKLAEEEKK